MAQFGKNFEVIFVVLHYFHVMKYNFAANDSLELTLRSPFMDDIPRAFRDSKHENYICGPYGQIIWNFAYYRRYNLQLEIVDSLRNMEIFDNIMNGTYNLSLHGGVYNLGNETLQFSYPVESYETCVLVPMQDELPKFYYIVMPLDNYIWITLALGSVYVAFLMHFIETPRKQNAAQSITRNVLYSAALLLYCSNMNVHLVNSGIRQMIFYLLLLVLGFMISAFHLSHMTTFCTKPIYKAPIDTVKQLLDENLITIVPDKTLDDLRDSPNYLAFAYLESYMKVIGQKDFRPLVKTLNRSRAYMVTQDQWDFIYRQQRYLKRPYFRLSKMCYQKRYQAIPMRLDASTWTDFHIFQLHVQEAGLWNQWMDEGFRRAVNAGYVYVLSDIYPVLPLDLSFFRFGWLVLAIGLIVSCCAMLVEVFGCRLFHRRRYGKT